MKNTENKESPLKRWWWCLQFSSEFPEILVKIVESCSCMFLCVRTLTLITIFNKGLNLSLSLSPSPLPFSCKQIRIRMRRIMQNSFIKTKYHQNTKKCHYDVTKHHHDIINYHHNMLLFIITLCAETSLSMVLSKLWTLLEKSPIYTPLEYE